MEEKVPNVFSGMMTLSGDRKNFDSFFYVNGNRVTVMPMTNKCAREILESSYLDNDKQQEEIWLYGVDDFGRSVAFLKRCPLRLLFTTSTNRGCFC